MLIQLQRKDSVKFYRIGSFFDLFDVFDNFHFFYFHRGKKPTLSQQECTSSVGQLFFRTNFSILETKRENAAFKTGVDPTKLCFPIFIC